MSETPKTRENKMLCDQPTELDFLSELNPKDALSQPPPPCEKYKCENFQKCKIELLACEAFHYYVMTGRSVSPRTTWDNENKGKKSDGRIDAATMPTRSRYLKIYG